MAHLKKLIRRFLAFRSMWAFGLIWICMLSIPGSGTAENVIIYGANAYDRADVIEINLTANTSRKAGDLLFDTEAIGQHPLNGRVYYFEWDSSGNELAYWDPVDGTNTHVITYNSTPWDKAKRAAFGPDGFLYLMDQVDMLYRIDEATGDWEYVGVVQGIQHGLFFSGTGDMAFSPDGLLYLVTQENLYEIDMQTLQATLLYSNMLPGFGQRVWTGLAFCNGLLYGSSATVMSGDSVIYRIDPANGDVTQLIDTGMLINDLTSCSVMAGNLPPVLEFIGDRQVSVGEALQINLTATDPNIDDMLTYSAEGLPAGATLNQSTGEFSWTPDEVGDSPYQVTFTVADDGEPPLDDTETIMITVYEPCVGDHEPDGDVDGLDIHFLPGSMADFVQSVQNFGRADCPTPPAP